jgi:hypothetical protein
MGVRIVEEAREDEEKMMMRGRQERVPLCRLRMSAALGSGDETAEAVCEVTKSETQLMRRRVR